MKPLLPLFLLLIISALLKAQGIKGTIIEANHPVAYANIYVPALKTGTTSNIEGQFELKLPPGEWEIIFQYLGYKTVTEHYHIGDKMKEVTIRMEPQNYQIKEIKVLASGEDPAYYIMRHAIAMAPYYDKQVAEYDCKLYLKGNGIIYKIPKMFKKKMKKEGIEQDKPYVMESLNKIHFELPNKLNQQVIAMRSSGDDRNTDPMVMITTSLYNVSKYGIVSPVGRNALKVYQFKLDGVFEDQGRLINKIKVSPKTKGQRGTFEGFINIVDNYWNIHSADLRFSVPFMDVSMRQLYAPVDTNTWMPVSLNFDIDMGGLGFGMKYFYVASFSDYKVRLNEQLDHSFLSIQSEKEEAAIIDSLSQIKALAKEQKAILSKNQEKIASLLEKEDLSTREMYKLERLMAQETERTLPPEPLELPERVKTGKNVIKNDSAYWHQIRPVPLTQSENIEFAKKDSIITAHSTPAYKDSIRDVRMKFKISDIMIGRNYRYGEDSTRYKSNFSIPGLFYPQGLSFNTVDGFTYSLPFHYGLTDTIGKQFNTDASATYAWSRKTLYADLSLYYRYNGINKSWISLSGGRKLKDFKNSGAISPMEYVLYTTFFEDNFQKFYESRFVTAGWGTEVVNGLSVSTGFSFSNRTSATNHSGYTFIDLKNRSYTPNIPPIPGLEEWQLSKNNAATGKIEFTFTPRQHYRIRDHVKYPAHSQFPTFKLLYEKGFNRLLGSDVNFDFLSLNIRQHMNAGFGDYLNYQIEAGKFLNNKILYAADYQFFNTNNQYVTLSNPDKGFYLPDYYTLYSRKHYIEGHITYDTDQLLIKRLPLIKGTLIGEKLRIGYLATESTSNYMELNYGLEDLFLMFDLEFTLGFQNWKYEQKGFRLSINLY
jgi:hypothetical protein